MGIDVLRRLLAVLDARCRLRRAVAPAAVLGFSGGLVGADRLAGAITSKPPIMLVHGEQDALAPIYGMMASVKALSEAGVVCQGVPIPGLGHEVNADALIYRARFLLSAFAFREKHGA